MKSHSDIRFYKKEYIDINNKSSEWIGIDLPVKTYSFIDYDKYLMYPMHYKRISTKYDIIWRVSYIKGNWIDVETFDIISKLENIYKKYILKLRKNKLEHILWKEQ